MLQYFLRSFGVAELMAEPEMLLVHCLDLSIVVRQSTIIVTAAPGRRRQHRHRLQAASMQTFLYPDKRPQAALEQSPRPAGQMAELQYQVRRWSCTVSIIIHDPNSVLVRYLYCTCDALVVVRRLR